MSEFTGERNRVRCVDCNYLSGTHCSKKNIKVAPRKRRTCAVYGFKGEYTNRTSPEAMYIPYVDGSTRRLLRKMIKMGIVPVAHSPENDSQYKGIPMPRTTATAGVLSVKPEHVPGEVGPEDQGITTILNPASKVPEVQKSEEKDESDSSGS